MSLWAFKAPLYSFVRDLPLVKNILLAEKTSLTLLLQQLKTPPTHHLDIGTGTGDSLSLFRTHERVVCLDASLAMLRRLSHQPKIVAHAEALPFADATFDFVSAIGVLEYVRDETRFFYETQRVLKPRGFLLFTSAPRSIANCLRGLGGERLYLRNEKEVRAALSAEHWRVIAHRRTFLQEQWLVQNRSADESS